MKPTTTTVNYAAAKIEPASRRPVLLLAVLPFSLLLLGSGLAPFLNQRAQASAMPLVMDSQVPNTPGVISSEVRLKQIRYTAALDTVERLEEKIRQSGGKARVTASDLRRLRNALLSAE